MKKITLLDGAVGTSLWNKAELKGLEKVPVWKYNIENPEIVEELCKEYADAGAEIVLTNTFGANGPSVKRSSNYTVEEVVKSGVRITKNALKGSGVKTMLAIGPLSMLLEPYGDLTEDEAREIFERQIGAGMEEKPDMILLQTFMDIEMMRIATTVAKEYSVPVLCSMTFEKVGKTLMGNSVQDVIDVLSPLKIDGIGLNCSLGPDLAVPVIKEFVGKTDIPLIFKPNAGKPILNTDGTSTTVFDPKTFADDIEPVLSIVDYVGGCCGSDPSYIRELRKRIT